MDTVENATPPADVVDTFPWDDPEPFVPTPWVPQLSASITVAPALGFSSFVTTHPELGLIATLNIGSDLGIHFTGGQPDEQVLDNIDRLAAALSALRAAVVIERMRLVPDQVPA